MHSHIDVRFRRWISSSVVLVSGRGDSCRRKIYDSCRSSTHHSGLRFNALIIDWLAASTELVAPRCSIGFGSLLWQLGRANGTELERAMPYAEQSAVSWPADSPDLVTAWLRGELVDRLGNGVDEGANVNASSSLSTRAPHDSRGHHRTAKV